MQMNGGTEITNNTNEGGRCYPYNRVGKLKPNALTPLFLFFLQVFKPEVGK